MQDNTAIDINEYEHLKKLSLRKIKVKSELSLRRLKPMIAITDDAKQIVLVNFTCDGDEIFPDYDHPVIGSIRQVAVFLKSPTPLTKDSPIELIKKADNSRKDIKTIASKNQKWINANKQPFNSLSDFEGQAWLVLYKEDYLNYSRNKEKHR